MDLPIALDDLLRREDASVEWKAGVADVEDVVRVLTAFANSSSLPEHGGWVVCGIREEKDEHGLLSARLVGLPADRFREIRHRVLHLCRERVFPPLIPNVYEHPVPVDPAQRILLFSVQATNQAHAFRGRGGSSQYWIRSGGRTVEAKGDLLRKLLRRVGDIPPLLEQPCHQATMDDLNRVAAEEFFQAAKLPRPAAEYLEPGVRIDLVAPPLVLYDKTARGDAGPIPTNLAVLLFSREPARFLPGAFAVFSAYPGTSRTDQWAERIEFTRALKDMIGDVKERLKAYTSMEGNRLRFSEEAIHEAVVNAFVHRDYESREPTRIAIFSDRIEIANPGGIGEGVDPERLIAGTEVPCWRNPALASFLLRMGLAYREGRGIPLIVERTLEVAGREPELRASTWSFEVTLPAADSDWAADRERSPSRPKAEPTPTRREEPPRLIRAITVKNFRGLHTAEITDLTRLVVLVGPNGSGKSSILDAIDVGANPWPGHAAGRSVRRRATAGSGFRWLLWKGAEEHRAEIVITTDGGSARRTVIERDGTTCLLEIHAGNGDSALQARGKVEFDPYENRYTQSLTDPVRMPGVSALRWVDLVGASRKPLYQLYSSAAEQGRREEAVAIVRSLLGESCDLQILTDQDRPVLHVVFADRSVPADLAGDGVAALLCLALELATEERGVVLLEEPELHQHPAGIGLAARAIVAACQRGLQVILTTHSLELIDALLEAHDGESIDQMTVCQTRLDDGELVNCNISGRDLEFVRTKIESDLR